jgi:hypothetical protein
MGFGWTLGFTCFTCYNDWWKPSHCLFRQHLQPSVAPLIHPKMINTTHEFLRDPCVTSLILQSDFPGTCSCMLLLISPFQARRLMAFDYQQLTDALAPREEVTGTGGTKKG